MVQQALLSGCGSEWSRQDDGGGGGGDDEKQGSVQCRSHVLACHFVHLGGGDDGWKCQLVSLRRSKIRLTDDRVHDHGDGDDDEHSSS